MRFSSFTTHCASLGIKHGRAQGSTAVLNHPSTGVLTPARPCSCNLAQPCTRQHGRVSSTLISLSRDQAQACWLLSTGVLTSTGSLFLALVLSTGVLNNKHDRAHRSNSVPENATGTNFTFLPHNFTPNSLRIIHFIIIN